MNTNRMFRVATAGAAVVAVIVSLAGCAGQATGGACDRSQIQNLGLVAGRTATQPVPDLSGVPAELLAQASESNGSVTIVVPSGNPRNVGTASLGSKAHDESVCFGQQRTAVGEMTAYASALTAKIPEANFLGAIEEAVPADSGNSMGVLVIGSGLQTVDPLDFSVDGLLYADPDMVAEDLLARGLLPEALAGQTVYWAGLGEVAGDQTPLTVPARSNLTAIWEAIITAAGGDLVMLPGGDTAGETGRTLPHVKTVPVRETLTKADWARPIMLRESELRFVFGSTQFVDPASAEATLRGLASSIIDSQQTITITGTASRDDAVDNTADLQLSMGRAETVKDELVRLGVPDGLLTAVGVGWDWCGVRSESDQQGQYSSLLAASNRMVILSVASAPLCES